MALMNTARQDGLLFIERGLRIHDSLPAALLITYIVGQLTMEEAWDVLAEAERIGMIERDEGIFGTTTREDQEWRLVKGFDVKQLEIAA